MLTSGAPDSPEEIRTPVTGSKAQHPWPLDYGASNKDLIIID